MTAEAFLKTVALRLKQSVRWRAAYAAGRIDSWTTSALEFAVLHRRLPGKRRPSENDCPVVVTLTSYPPRFPTLAPTLRSLLTQTAAPDHVVLWIAEQDAHLLPSAVSDLVHHGLTIKTCQDVKSYKKIIPSLSAYPGAMLVTADDDVYYPRRWLENLLRAHDPKKKEVVCYRARTIEFDPASQAMLPYESWALSQDGCSARIFPTGMGGVLYPPGVLPTETSNSEQFSRLCPQGDDIWLFWMASSTGATFRKIGGNRRYRHWRASQHVALFKDNITNGGNDVQIENMMREYGLPLTLAQPLAR